MSLNSYLDNASDPLLSNPRVLGSFENGLGPTILCLCGMHGNEQSGIKAFNNVASVLDEKEYSFHGHLVGLVGNLKAVREGVRFIDFDLNRLWASDNLRALQVSAEDSHAEEEEQRSLLDTMSGIFKHSTGPIYILDLHTTSSSSSPFISINDTIRNRDFAKFFPFTIVLGIEEFLVGTLLNHINELGHVALGIEAGQHYDPNSILIHEMAIWLGMSISGFISSQPPSQINSKILAYSQLKNLLYEVRYRREINDNERFTMLPGYQNFNRVKKGEIVAISNQHHVTVPETAKIFMPLYQKQGQDGYFLVREIRPIWLKLSRWLRKINFSRYATLLPGISRYQNRDYELLVNTKIAKWLVVDFFHLMGFRRKQKTGKYILFRRRQYDFIAPELTNLTFLGD